MDGQRFDALTRALAAGSSRRRLLRILGGGATAGVLGLLGANAVAADCADRCNRLPAGDGRDQCLAACTAATQASGDADAARAQAQALRDCDGDASRLCGGGTDVTCCAPDEVCTDSGCAASGSPCPTGQAACGGNCVDLSSDPDNCGACDQRCVVNVAHATPICTDGTCGIACVDGYFVCNDVCCANGLTCGDGICQCPGGETDCGHGCTDLTTDPQNCGQCGNFCENGEGGQATCDNGQCGFQCDTGFSPCGKSCCADDAVCQNGECSCPPGACGCPSGQTNCPDGCVDLMNDPKNCGGCDLECSLGEPPFDPNAIAACGSGHCGFVCASGFDVCGHGCCSAELLCINDTCVCPNGGQDCGNGCIDVTADPDNCGECGLHCETSIANAHPVCQDGRCGFACNDGFIPCGEACVAADNPPANCATCGDGCPFGPRSCCAGLCVDLSTDLQNCGACGRVCDTTNGQTCSRGRCGCPIGMKECAGICSDLSEDLSNCGACGHACGAGQICRNGHCLTPCDNFFACPDSCSCAETLVEENGTIVDGPLLCVTNLAGIGVRCSHGTICPTGAVCLNGGPNKPNYCAALCGA